MLQQHRAIEWLWWEGTLKVTGLQPHAGLYGATAIQHVFKSRFKALHPHKQTSTENTAGFGV